MKIQASRSNPLKDKTAFWSEAAIKLQGILNECLHTFSNQNPFSKIRTNPQILDFPYPSSCPSNHEK